MRWLPLILLLLASTASAQQTLYLRDLVSTLSSCPGDDRQLTLAGDTDLKSEILGDESPGENWNYQAVASSTLNGAWDCTLRYYVVSGTGPGNKFTVDLQRVDSSCAVQQTIFSEETGTLSEGSWLTYECTGDTSESVTFAAGEALMLTVYRTNGNQSITTRYNAADPNNANVVIPSVETATQKILIIN